MPFRMPVKLLLSIAMLALALGLPLTVAQAADEPTGTWLTQAGDARVRVSRCGGGLCGTVIWLRDKLDPATGKPPVDDKNPNPARRNHSMIGLSIFIGMKPSGPNKWSGQIYNSDDGKTYVSNISVGGPDTLKVEGCVGALCGGETWTRVSN